MLRTQSSGSVRVTWIDRPALLRELEERAARLGRDHPEIAEVVLFGSVARGSATPESDIDILLIVDETGVPFLLRADPYRDVFADLPFDVFPLAYTQSERERMLREGNLFLCSAFEDAVYLYRRA
ncbi:MAG TPA: nucleotidyltransferase domain-containing protein [Thermoanaerobaculia bacterium]|nr:nucleotidyltransferase domain-containing protein [Thermoanaerobaculia bacterium]